MQEAPWQFVTAARNRPIPNVTSVQNPFVASNLQPSAAPDRTLRSNQPRSNNNDVEMAEPDHPPRQDSNRPLPNPVSNRVVIFDNIVGLARRELEPELCRVAPWLQPDAVDIMRSGGLRVKCKTPADAERLLKRDGFPPNSFTPGFTVHRPGKQDNNRPISEQLERDLRSVICSRIPIYLSAADLRDVFAADYVESVRDIPPRNLEAPPLRVIVMKTRELREDALNNGLKFYNRRINVRPLRPPVLPLFCRKCSGYGHTAVDCKQAHPTCAKCSGHHLTITCLVQRRDAQCPHCPAPENNHFATYRGCPAFKTACAVENEHRQARVAAKLAARERRMPQRAGPTQPRSNAPAPIQPGVSFADAANRNLPRTAAVQQPAQQQPRPGTVSQQISVQQLLAAPNLPPSNATIENTVLGLLQSIRADIASIRQQQTAFEQTLTALQKQQQRLEEQFAGYNDYMDDHDMDAMDDNDAHFNATPTDG